MGPSNPVSYSKVDTTGTLVENRVNPPIKARSSQTGVVAYGHFYQHKLELRIGEFPYLTREVVPVYRAYLL